ncbi:MAG: hypothetical protein A2X84_12520, partial [Desulfuromonadaceae bacterium GWC2_58_13]
MPITINTTVVRTEGLMTAPVDNDIVILNMKGNNYLSLDSIGRRIWELLAAPILVTDLCRQLATEFQGGEEQIAADVLAFLARLEAEGLVLVVA